MPRVHFTISSVSEPTFAILTQGYHRQDGDRQTTGVGAQIIFLWKCINSVCRRRKLPQKATAQKTPRSVSPLIDPQFLLFALLVTDYLRRGYQAGHMGGSGAFVPYKECTLSSSVPNTIMLGQVWVLPITPHKHVVDIGDIPEYARLLKLKQLTRDTSVSALLNRLALWLYLFVHAYHYGWKLVLYHPKTEDRKVLSSAFFAKFSHDMSF